MTRTRTFALAFALLTLAPPAATAATLTYEPTNGQIGTYVLTADATGGDLILSGIVQSGAQGDVKTIQFQYEGGAIDYSSVPADYCTVYEGDTRLYCGVAEGDSFRYEGSDATDELSLGVGDTLYPWMAVTFNGRGGADRGIDDHTGNTVPRIWDGGPGNDKLSSYAGADKLLGGDGDDELIGGAGAQELRGHDGNDKLTGDSFSSEFGGDIIDGGAGNDEGGDWYIPGDSVHPPISVTQDGAADDGRPGENDNVTSIERISTGGSTGTFQGTDGNDDFQLYTTDGSTTTLFAGNDKFAGRSANETVDGGAGNDNLSGGFGHDTITGGPGQDVINGDGGSYCGIYSCSVPFGNDTINARDGEADTIECGVGEDTVTADALDTVAPSCEKVDAAGTGPGGSTPGGTTPGGSAPGGGSAAAGDFGLRWLGKKSLRALLRSGTAFQVTCPGACQVRGRLVYRSKTIASGGRTLLAGGNAKVVAKVTKKNRRKLRRLRRAKFTLKVTIRDAAGKTTSFTRTLTFKK